MKNLTHPAMLFPFWHTLFNFLYSVILLLFISGGSVAQSPDPNFDGDGIKLSKINAARDDISQSVAVTPDGKIVVAGNSINSNGYSNIGVVRYKWNGTPDNTLNGTGKIIISNAFCSNVTVQADKKIVVSGTVTIGNTGTFRIWRFNENGSPDNTFGISGVQTVSFTNGVISFALTLQPDGKILAGGYQQGTGGSAFGSMVLFRLTASGMPDNSFGSNGKFSLSQSRWALDCHKILVQPDGKIVTAGKADTITLSAIVYSHFFSTRINANGTLDAAYGINGIVKQRNSYNDYCYSAGLLPGGKIVLGGFSIIGSSNLASALCLNANGTVNNLFGNNGWKYVDYGGSSIGRGIAIQGDGKIILAGNANLNAIGIARLNTDGTPDASFGNNGVDTLAFNTYAACNAVALQSNGKIVITGYKDQGYDYFLTVRFNIPQVQPKEATSVTMELSPHDWDLYPNPVIGSSFNIRFHSDASTPVSIRIMDAAGREALTQVSAMSSGDNEIALLLPASIKNGAYFCEVMINGKLEIKRVVVQR
jgi:uncharacterized delta-60 repeat protein